MKRCNTCEIDKPLSEYYMWRAGSPEKGYRPSCKLCVRKSSKNAKGDGGYQRQYMRLDRQVNPEKYRNLRLKRVYGITLDEFNALLLGQSGRCAICNDPMTNPHVDHSHATKRVRALLCSRCNVGLGQFLESPERLLAAIAYLREHSV